MASLFDQIDTLYQPENNAVIKFVVAGAVAWGVFVCLSKGNRDKNTSSRQKFSKVVNNHGINNLINSRNRSSGKKNEINPDQPYYSRQNYNRRRRPS